MNQSTCFSLVSLTRKHCTCIKLFVFILTWNLWKITFANKIIDCNHLILLKNDSFTPCYYYINIISYGYFWTTKWIQYLLLNVLCKQYVICWYPQRVYCHLNWGHFIVSRLEQMSILYLNIKGFFNSEWHWIVISFVENNFHTGALPIEQSSPM